MLKRPQLAYQLFFHDVLLASQGHDHTELGIYPLSQDESYLRKLHVLIVFLELHYKKDSPYDSAFWVFYLK